MSHHITMCIQNNMHHRETWNMCRVTPKNHVSAKSLWSSHSAVPPKPKKQYSNSRTHASGQMPSYATKCMPRKAFDRHKAVIVENWSTYQIWSAISTMKHSGWLSTRYCKLWHWPPWEVIPLVLMGWTKNYSNVRDHYNHLPGDDNNRQLHESGIEMVQLERFTQSATLSCYKNLVYHPQRNQAQNRIKTAPIEVYQSLHNL